MSTTLPMASGRATLTDLQKTPGKAELIGGRIVPLMPTGLRLFDPAVAAWRRNGRPRPGSEAIGA